jgi:hypothetical protein
MGWTGFGKAGHAGCLYWLKVDGQRMIEKTMHWLRKQVHGDVVVVWAGCFGPGGFCFCFFYDCRF